MARANEINPTTSPGSPGTIGRCAHLLAYLPYLPAFACPRSTAKTTGDTFSTSTYLLRRSPASRSSAVEGGRRALPLLADRRRGVQQQKVREPEFVTNIQAPIRQVIMTTLFSVQRSCTAMNQMFQVPLKQMWYVL